MSGTLDGCGAGEMDSLVSSLELDLNLGLMEEGGDGLDVFGEGVWGFTDGGGVSELSPSIDFVLRFAFLFLMAELEKL